MSSPSLITTTMSLFSLFILSLFLSQAHAQVPSNATFKFVNEGEFGPYVNEYDANYRVLDVFASPFQLCFYNTTPNAYYLALRMAIQRTEPIYRWVWEANRGNPVKENATLTFGTDGNLVLAEADGKVAWQTNTANKGVVGFKLLPNGNIVLHDSKGNFVWQSFDHPTDTLLVGQSLKVGGVTKLVSRLSEQQNADGPYSLVMEPKGLSFYYKSNNSARPLLYFFSSDRLSIQKGSLESVQFQSEPETDEAYAYELRFAYQSKDGSSGGTSILSRPKYNATSSFLRLGIDGNVKIYTYYDKVSWGGWQVTFTLFDRESFWDVSECQLPERCGNLGVCEDNQCVACPSANGLIGWSKSCQAEKVTSCRPSDFHYYKVVGVDHFLSKFTKGDSVKESVCESKCSKDCKCLGYFYNQQSSRCWIAYELKTLTKVENSTHVGYIKAPNH
ncbi:epidermis-specific secreted glycoprotein EP1 [Ziziphus jujuba]|uniref:Epidermis-specific secreted glycoprotein EP1 n=1 Tax=Ziziphus jujuba TaxID=326968 RepID=A0A6P4ARD2_ZIZJJ|nr:epidermis-specific secreted glycoprotein EP1 [Ziziphus jujuba]